MKFYLQWDGKKRSRAYKSFGSRVEFFRVNHAIQALKACVHAHRLCYVEDGTGSRRTLMFFEGTGGKGIFLPSKLRTLYAIGESMYIPKTSVRKTTRRRKRRCKKSKNLTGTGVYAKFTPRDSNSHL